MRLRIPKRIPAQPEAVTPRSPLALLRDASSGHRGEIIRVSVVAAVGGFAEAIVLVSIARLAFALASGDDRITLNLGPVGSATISVPALIAVAAGLTALRGGLLVEQARLNTRTFASVWTSVRVRLLRSYLGASWALQAAERDGRLQELVTTYALNSASTVASLSGAAVAFVSLVTFVVTAVFINAIAALVVVVAFVASGFALRPIRHSVRRRSRRAADANLAFATAMTETATNMQEIRVFGVEAGVRTRIEDRVRDAAELDRRARFIGQVTPAIYQTMALLLIVGAVAVVYATGASRLASLGGIVLIMIRSLSYGQALQANYQSIYQTAPFLEMLDDEMRRYEAATTRVGGAPVERLGDLALERVWYEYAPDRPVLRDVSLHLTAGEIVGIVGPSGSGKSTLVQILLRLREPTSGDYLAGGRDVRSLALHDWYKRVSFVPQDARLIAGSVADNIKFFRDDIDDAAVERAAKLANLHDEIELMEARYATSVGERGSALSGGQRQRLSIARALAGQPDLVVLDEPTSSLDVRSEALIRDTIRDLAPAATVVIIAHRMSTLEMCDRIMVVLGGRIEGFDTPERLEASNPFYREALELSGLR